MRVLFLHQNYPGQFLHIERALREANAHDLMAVVPHDHARPIQIPSRRYPFNLGDVRSSVRLAEHYTERVARGAAVATTLMELSAEGFTPDVVLAHGGWGESLFVRDVWPDCRLLVHAEFHYTAEGALFDPAINGVPDQRFLMDVRTRNVGMTLALLEADRGIAPTPWQASVFPPFLKSKLDVVHEGIDTAKVRPSAAAQVKLGENGPSLKVGDEVVTFVNRELEPHRGFHIFMRALPTILARRPEARVVIVGGDGSAYGPPPPPGASWKAVMLAEVGERLDLDRVHFVGRVPYVALIELLRISAAHVYWTYPFVLSWSMLDAMSAGALVIGSRTGPVEDVIEHGRNGVLCDFFDVEGLADAVVNALAKPERYRDLRLAGRQTIKDRFDLQSVCLPRWLEFLRK